MSNLYDQSRHEAARQNAHLRIKLRIRPAELARLPWEFLYDPRQDEYICLSRTPIVRFLDLQQPVRSLEITPPLRILVMIASPPGRAPLEVEREQQRMDRALSGIRGQVKLDWLGAQTNWHDLQRAIRELKPHVFHFIGHGGFNSVRDEGFIALTHEDGETTHHLGANELARLLAGFNSLRLVLLNACEGARGSEHDVFSSTAAVLMRRSIPAVLAMQYEISDEAASQFAHAFYEALADGHPVDAAVSEARIAMSLASSGSLEWGTPVLYLRAPDGVLRRSLSDDLTVHRQPNSLVRARSNISPVGD